MLAIRKTSLPTKNHVLAVSAKLMLANGYRNTTIKEIAKAAGVSVSSIQNFFGNKEGLLTELTRMMFAGQFGAARNITQEKLPPIYTYAAETAIQLVLTEHNENLREIYTEVYTLPETLELVRQYTTQELKAIFADRFPNYLENDFYEMEIGSSALMSAYMAKPCDVYFPLERKIERFLTSALRIYCVSEEEIRQVVGFIQNLDVAQLAEGVVQQLFATMETYYEKNVLHPTSAAEKATESLDQ